MILSIETATPVCSVALQNTAGRIFEKRIEGRGVHSERTFLFIRELLERSESAVSDLDAVLFSVGPGSYTGLRIGASAVKGILFGRDVALYTFPTLTAFAAGAGNVSGNQANIFSVIDARRNHLYVQQIQKGSGGGYEILTTPSVKTLQEIESEIQDGDVLAGTGWERLNLAGKNVQTFGTNIISAANLIHAWTDESLSKSFKKEDPASFEPEYLNMAQVNNSSV